MRTLFRTLPLDEWGVRLHVSDPVNSAGRDTVTLSLSNGEREQYKTSLKPEVVNSFICALQESAKRDKIWESDKDLQQTLANLKTFLISSSTPATVRRSTALQIISLLPILPHWDLWGAIRQGWDPSEERGVPPSPFQRLGKLQSPFYSNHFVYQYDGSNDTGLLSKKLLGYSVLAEAHYVDLSVHRPPAKAIHLRDYFDYACAPQGKELQAYQLYALLLDRLQLALSGQPEASDKKSRIEHLYYVAWPIFTHLGRRHFLQLYARPVPDSPAPLAQDLLDAFLELHQHLSWRDLRAILVEELTQVDLDRFHAHIAADNDRISKERYVKDQHGEAHLGGLMARNLHLLMPVEFARYERQAEWGYRPIGEEIPLGYEWSNGVNWLKTHSESFGSLEWYPASTGKETPTQRELRKALRSRLVERQLRAIRRDWQAKKEDRERKRDDAERRWKTVHYPHLAAQAHAVLPQIKHNEHGRNKFHGVTFRIGNTTGVQPAEMFQPFFYHQGHDPNDQYAWEEAYRCLLTANGHLVISYFVETGVLPWLVHPSHEKDQRQRNGILDSFNSSCQALSVITSQRTGDSHNTCIECIQHRVLDVITQGTAETITPGHLRQNIACATLFTCATCGRYSNRTPAWLVAPHVTPNTNLADLQHMRDHAFRLPGSNYDKERFRNMVGLQADDAISINIPSSPVIHIAPAGIPGWTDAVDKLRGTDGTLKVFFFASRLEPLQTGDNFYGPTHVQKNYICLFKAVTEEEYRKLGTIQVDRVNAFGNICAGLGSVFLIKLSRQGGQTVAQQYFSLPTNTEVGALIEVEHRTLSAFNFEELNNGFWEGIVIVLERVKHDS